MITVSGMKIGCFTPVKDRELYLRSCLMQMMLQTRLPDAHIVLINGENAASYDLRAVADLIEPWMSLVPIARSMTTREAYTLALELLLQSDVEIFFKIDSDDIYCRNYIEVILEQIASRGLHERQQGFCLNLVDQLWLNASPDGSATIRDYTFRTGLGISKEEEARGIRVGAPPTFVFDRPVAELLVRHARRDPYSRERFEDRAWRNILREHEILIELVGTPNPVFGYLRHSGNISTLKKKTP